MSANSSSALLRRTKFLAFGDSFTMGEVTNPIVKPGGSFKMLVVPEASYPTRLLQVLRAAYPEEAEAFEVVNAGFSGEWAQDGAKRLPKILDTTHAEVLLLLEGANDLAALDERGINPAIAAVTSMVREAKVRGMEVMLATLLPSRPGGERSMPAALVTKFNERLRQLALTDEAILVDIYGQMLNDIDRNVGIDGLHPNEAGYMRIAELFAQAIRVSYAIEPR